MAPKNISPKKLDEWETLANRATKGPWRRHGYSAEVMCADDAPDDAPDIIANCDLDRPGNRLTGGTPQQHADADFITETREAVPALIESLRFYMQLVTDQHYAFNSERDALVKKLSEVNRELEQVQEVVARGWMKTVTSMRTELDQNKATLQRISEALDQEGADHVGGGQYYSLDWLCEIYSALGKGRE